MAEAATLPVPAWGEGLCEVQEEAVAVGYWVGGIRVSVGDTVGVCERKVSVAATEAEALGQAVWEAVGDWDRTVSEAAGEAVPAAALAVAWALPVPGGPVELSMALGEAEGVARAVGGMKVKDGVKEAVDDCERKVAVARGVPERVEVGDCECAVTVAANEAVAAMGLPVPPREGLREALGQLLAVEVPEGEAMHDVLAEASAEGGALDVALWQSVCVDVALWQSVCKAEGESSMAFRAPSEAVWEGEPVAGLLGKPVAVMEDVLEVVVDPLGESLETGAAVTAPKLQAPAAHRNAEGDRGGEPLLLALPLAVRCGEGDSAPLVLLEGVRLALVVRCGGGDSVPLVLLEALAQPESVGEREVESVEVGQGEALPGAGESVRFSEGDSEVLALREGARLARGELLVVAVRVRARMGEAEGVVLPRGLAVALGGTLDVSTSPMVME